MFNFVGKLEAFQWRERKTLRRSKFLSYCNLFGLVSPTSGAADDDKREEVEQIINELLR